VKTGLQRVSREGFHLEDASPRTLHTDRVQEAAATYLKTHPIGPGMEDHRRFREPNTAALSEGAARTDVKSAPSITGGEGSVLSGFSEEARPLGQIFDTYILARIHGELWIIDQHAAHERVLYERFLKAMQESQIPVQRMLIPQTLELSRAQMMVLKERLDPLESLGLEIESFGPQSLVIRAVPAFLAKADLQGLVVDLIEDWSGMEKNPSAEERRKGLAATMACHGAIKANDGLTVPEMEALLKDVLQLPTAMTCPHGRPLRVKFSRKELDGMFHR
jgi:DNA mismatch repair protein MutL